jgi:hypothetical protein
MTFTHADYPAHVLQYVSTGVDLTRGPGFPTTATFKPFIAPAGCDVPPASGKANLVFGVPHGVTVTTTPAVKVVYTDEGGIFNPALTSMPADVSDEIASAIACDVAPGHYTVDITGATGTCSLGEGWPSAGHTAEMLAEANRFTLVNWICK